MAKWEEDDWDEEDADDWEDEEDEDDDWEEEDEEDWEDEEDEDDGWEEEDEGDWEDEEDEWDEEPKDTYTKKQIDEIIAHIRRQLTHDQRQMQKVHEAVINKRRDWLAQLVIEASKILFGSVVGGVVDRVVTWFLTRWNR